MPSSPAPRYAGLDGLRAVAVLLVVVYHLFPSAFLHSGFVGVDAFFVISGFLITSLLLRERAATGRIALRAFWVRRARRLLPALALVVTVSASAAWLVGGDVLVGLGRQVLGAATFSYNWLSIAAGTSYFSAGMAGGQPELLRNLWSLAVEEQFYVLWPLLLPLVLLVRGRVARVAVALALATGSAVWAVAAQAAGASITRAYFGTDTHAFGLLLGVALAFALARVPSPSPEGALVRPEGALAPAATLRIAATLATVGVVALTALVVISAWPGGASNYPTVPLAASLATAVLIAAAVHPASPLGAALDVAPLRWIGERSYGIYLWHWPVVVLLGQAAVGRFTDATVPIPVGIAAALVTTVAAALSYRLLEQPVRRLGFRGALRALGARLGGAPARRFGALTTLAAGVLVVGGTTAAVAAAPAVSSSEAVVAAGARALAEASAAPSAATTPRPASEPSALGAAPSPSPTPSPASDATPRTGRHGKPLPPPPAEVSGDRITAVGDSVMLASAEGLLGRFPGIQVDAAVSRSMWAGGEIIDGLSAQGALRDYLVVGLGTNGPVDAADLQEIYDTLGPHRSLVLVTAYAPRDWIPGVNAELAAFAASHPRVVIADWSQAIAPHLDYLAGDEIHPGPTGGQLYAATVADAVDAAENQRAEVAYQVALVRWATARALASAASPTP